MSSFCLLLLLLLSVYLSLRFVFRKEKLTLVSSPPMMMDGETKSDAKEKQNRFLFQYRKREPRQTITTRNEKGGMRSTETKQNSLSLSLAHARIKNKRVNKPFRTKEFRRSMRRNSDESPSLDFFTKKSTRTCARIYTHSSRTRTSTR